jgi:hypothetical protein
MDDKFLNFMDRITNRLLQVLSIALFIFIIVQMMRAIAGN